MYCGDEVFSVVGDLGTATSRFGYAGEDLPKAVFPSAVGHVVDAVEGGGKKKKGDAGASSSMDVDEAAAAGRTGGNLAAVLGEANIGLRRTDLELSFPMENGHVRDWEAVERIWAHAFGQLAVRDEAKGVPFMYALPTWATRAESQKVMELAFERFEMGALYLARSAMLSAFSTGRASGIVCDCGAGSTSAVPLLDGYVLNQLVGRSERGGDWLDGKVGEWLASKKVTVRPFGQQQGVMAEVMPPHYRQFQEQRVLRDMKESCCLVPQADSDDGAMFDVEDNDPEDGVYELPDGTKVKIDKALRRLPESVMLPGNESASSSSSPSSPPPEPQDLPGLVYAAVEQADVDVRKEFLGNVILTGAGSCFRGAAERLQFELTEKVPVAYKVKVVTATPLERRFSAWIGGSIMASLGSFQQLWLSKLEYEEMGAERALLERFR
jgi:actin-like protein 6A